mgnify:FL=1
MNKTMFRGLILLLCSTVPAMASEMNWSFKSPAFHYGNGYSSHVLSVEQLQFNRQEDLRKRAESEQARIERELNNTVLSKFIRNLESRIYAQLSKQMVDSMFDDACSQAEDPSTCTSPSSGVATVEGATITWVKSTDGSITLTVDGVDGYTEITIPGAGEFFF